MLWTTIIIQINNYHGLSAFSFLSGTVMSTLYIMTYLISPTNLSGGCFHPHFTDEKSETWGNLCQWSRVSKWQSVGTGRHTSPTCVNTRRNISNLLIIQWEGKKVNLTVAFFVTGSGFLSPNCLSNIRSWITFFTPFPIFQPGHSSFYWFMVTLYILRKSTLCHHLPCALFRQWGSQGGELRASRPAPQCLAQSRPPVVRPPHCSKWGSGRF